MEATVRGMGMLRVLMLRVLMLMVRVWLEERLPGLRFAVDSFDRMQRQEQTPRRRGSQWLRVS